MLAQAFYLNASLRGARRRRSNLALKNEIASLRLAMTFMRVYDTKNNR